MAKGMPRWTLGGLTFNDETVDEDGISWTLEDEEGFWGSGAHDHQFTPRIGQHGSFMVPGYIPNKAITLTCSARAQRDDFTSLRHAQNKAAAICGAPGVLEKLVCYAESGPLYMSVARGGDILTKPLYIERPAFEFSVQLRAPDPRRYALDPIRQQTTLPQQSATGLDFVTTGGLDFTTTGGLHFGAGAANSGFLELANTGTAPTSPLIWLYGPLTSPLVNTSAGAIKYNGTLANGEFVLIDPSDPSVLFNGTENRSWLVNPAAWNAFEIAPGGTLQIGLSHSGPATDTGWLATEFSPAYY